MCNVKLSRNRPDFEKLSRDRGQQPRTLYSSLPLTQLYCLSSQYPDSGNKINKTLIQISCQN